MNKSKNTRNIFSIIIIILCLIFVFLLFTFIHEWKVESEPWTVSTETLYHYVDNGDYPRLYQMCCKNRAQNVKEDANLRELYAVADYYHNAFYYYGLQDTEGADLSSYQEGMKQAAASAGDLSYAIEDIDSLFTDSSQKPE